MLPEPIAMARNIPHTPRLTPRERQIASLVAAGCSNVEIANSLGLRPQTIKNQLTSMYDKLGLRSRVDLALYTVRTKIS